MQTTKKTKTMPADEAKNLGDEVVDRETCGFMVAWVGRCKESKPCAKHGGRICTSCGAPAIQECDSTGQFVCGEYLCGECEHTIFPDGTNGGVGFNAADLPEGMKRHCKQSEQRYQPWYARQKETSDHGTNGQAS